MCLSYLVGPPTGLLYIHLGVRVLVWGRFFGGLESAGLETKVQNQYCILQEELYLDKLQSCSGL